MCHLSIFVSLFFLRIRGETTLRDRRGPFRSANKTAVSGAIKRGTAHRCWQSNAAFAAGWDASLRGRQLSGPGAGHTRRDTAPRRLPPSGWGALGKGWKRCKAALVNGANLVQEPLATPPCQCPVPFLGWSYWNNGSETPIQSCPGCADFDEVGRPLERGHKAVGTRSEDPHEQRGPPPAPARARHAPACGRALTA